MGSVTIDTRSVARLLDGSVQFGLAAPGYTTATVFRLDRFINVARAEDGAGQQRHRSVHGQRSDRFPQSFLPGSLAVRALLALAIRQAAVTLPGSAML